ncbi:MAG TPA: hypothetical protein VGP90_01105 [Acidimicrobiia bacterium]|nr:hypothetical protein [Acidimicrobiia bacterium]
MPAGRQCGGPDQAPGFEVPARRGVAPDTVCMDLQLAQDKAQAAGVGISARDSTGRGRRQVYDRDWVVISQTPPAGRPTGHLLVRVLAYGDPGAPPAPDRATPGRMPRLSCFDLQEAQDTLQSAGFTALASRDATGRGRHQIVDRDWTVTGQAPPPGGTWPKTTRVTLQAVRHDEASTCR